MMQKKQSFWIFVDCLEMGVKLGAFYPAIYGKVERCSFK